MKNYLLSIFTLFSSVLFSQTISTIAGTGLSTYNGNGLLATATNIGNSGGIVLNNSGELINVDSNNHVLRKIDLNGVMTIIAGNLSAGYQGDNVLATTTSLYSPSDLIIDSMGNIIFCEFTNCRIRKIDSNGIITTIAGNGECSTTGDNGLAIQSTIAAPINITNDLQGNLYFSQAGSSGNYRVRKIDTNGIITTIAGTGIGGYNGDNIQATSAQMNYPLGVAVDSQGNVFVAEYFGQRIRKIDTNGIITTIAGTGIAGFNGTNIQATNAQISGPTGMKLDAQGNLYFVDANNNRIRKINSNGVITTVAGSGLQGYFGDGGNALSAMFDRPSDILFSPNGSMYISDNFNYRIRRVTNVLSNEDFTVHEDDIQLAPNPSVNGITTLYFPDLVNEIKVFDLLGQNVLSEKVDGKNNLEISLQNSGIYLVTFYSVGEIITKKLVVQ